MSLYPSREELLSALEYHPETGEFIWKWREGTANNVNQRFSGKPAGKRTGYGYRQIRVDYRGLMAHRIAWIIMTGREPIGDIDHINLDRFDNRWCNLRECTRSENKANTRPPSTNTSGTKGVAWFARAQKWRARIKIDGKEHHLGLFETKEAAAGAYRKAALRSFGEFARAA